MHLLIIIMSCTKKGFIKVGIKNEPTKREEAYLLRAKQLCSNGYDEKYANSTKMVWQISLLI